MNLFLKNSFVGLSIGVVVLTLGSPFLYAEESNPQPSLSRVLEQIKGISAPNLIERQARHEELIRALNERFKEMNFVPVSVTGLRDYYNERSYYENKKTIQIEVQKIGPYGSPAKTYTFDKRTQRLTIAEEGKPSVTYSPNADADAYNAALRGMVQEIGFAYNFTSYSPPLTASQKTVLKAMSDKLMGVLFREFAKVGDFSATVQSSQWTQNFQYLLTVEKIGDILKIKHTTANQPFIVGHHYSDTLSLNFEINLKTGDMKYVQIPGHSVGATGTALTVFETWKYTMGPYPNYKSAIYYGIYQTLNYDPTNNATIRRASNILSRIKVLLNF